MNTHKSPGKPDASENKPEKEELNATRDSEGIIEGAQQEDQLDNLKPDPETQENLESQPEQVQVNKGDGKQD